MPRLTYALVTPARNEEAFLDATIRSVIGQTIRPTRWVIVSDGSTDGTDAIIERHAAEHAWIEKVRMPDRRDRQFAAKAHAFNAGYARVKDLPVDVIGNLDADITLPPDYYEFLLQKLEENPRIGVAGTPFVEGEDAQDHTYAHQFANTEHVSGACQFFRKSCFDEVGGYVPVKGGAIDWIAVTTARMKGWETRTFTQRVCHHHRKIGTATHGALRMRFHYGRKAYYVGGHPAWEVLRGVFAMRSKPYLLGGLWFIAGFLWSSLRRIHRPVSPELMAFHRGEQLTRLRSLLRLRAKPSNRPSPST